MIYLDNSATTQPYPEVVKSYSQVATQFFANPSSLHGLGGTVEKLYRESKKQMAQLLQVDAHELIMTASGTESNNMALKSVAWTFRNRGKHIITTQIEHPSVLNTMAFLEKNGFEVTYLPVDKQGQVAVADVEKHLRPDTILVSIMHVNNEIGSIQPIQAIGDLLADYDHVLFHVDAVQSLTKVPLAIKAMKIDLLSASAHKFHGVRGAGILYKNKYLRLEPLLHGGGQEEGFRSGTENVAAVVAMAKALRMEMARMQTEVSQLAALKNDFILWLQTIEAVTVYSSTIGAPHICCFSIKGQKGEVVVHALEAEGIYISTTSACSSKSATIDGTLIAMKVPNQAAKGAVRFSFNFDITAAKMAQVKTAVTKVIKNLSEVVN
ncbi:cysteine desulfurase family protein [Brochothrix campestris]|uniref:Cysteine desulfurase n=1 Tax=Brochothrix campestris FSL F6-1037 TaxID=1265861 RepID=W7CTU3_9LIST|nr:cysteine desulfurase family protein [Brochothrix campestris]EUJ40135.1 cysteine desulfurase [Brochothrix campestris FSL F6-1037]